MTERPIVPALRAGGLTASRVRIPVSPLIRKILKKLVPDLLVTQLSPQWKYQKKYRDTKTLEETEHGIKKRQETYRCYKNYKTGERREFRVTTTSPRWFDK